MELKYLRSSFFAVIFCFLVSCTAEDVPVKETASDTPALVLSYDYTLIEVETMALINNYRVSKGLNALEKINHMIFNLFLIIYVFKQRDLMSLNDTITSSKVSKKIKVF